MELNKAIQELSDMCDIVRCGDYYSLENDDIEAIDTVLTELDKLQKAKEEMTAEEFLRIRDMECIKYVECDDKCKFKRGGECVALCRIAVQIAKEIKEGNNEQI